MIYFISDLHLGARYIADPRAHQQRVVDFLRSIAADATELYLVGDVLDYWFEYRTAVPRGYVRFFGALAALADTGVKITWLTGNHDIWLFDYLRTEIGMEVIDAPWVERTISGKRFIIGHGDRIGRRSVGFRFICSLFRNRLLQWLYSGIHPRWTIPFAHWWSSSSRKSRYGIEDVEAHANQVELNAATLPSADFVVLGHHHIVVDRAMENGRLIVLGDWIDNFTYGQFDGSNFTLKTFHQ